MSASRKAGLLVGTLFLLWAVPTALYLTLYGGVYLYARLTGQGMWQVTSRSTLHLIVALAVVALLVAGALLRASTRAGRAAARD